MELKGIDDAKALAGRTFERDGQRRTIVRIDDLGVPRYGDYLVGNVFWSRPGGRVRKVPQWMPYFLDWLKGATEVAT